MMRQTTPYAVFLLVTTLSVTLSGCGTTSTSRQPASWPSGKTTAPSRDYDADPVPPSDSPDTTVPPPPVPAATEASFIKSIGFLRVFSPKDPQDCSDTCADSASAAPCSEDCLPPQKKRLFSCLRNKSCLNLFSCKASCEVSDDCTKEETCCEQTCDKAPECGSECATESGCTHWADLGTESGSNRHPCLSDRLDDPFLEMPAEPEALPDVPEVPEPVTTSPQSVLPSPYTGISSDRYFPEASRPQQTIVEPPPWRGRQKQQSVSSHRPVSLTVSDPELPSWPQPLVIQPRPSF